MSSIMIFPWAAYWPLATMLIRDHRIGFSSNVFFIRKSLQRKKITLRNELLWDTESIVEQYSLPCDRCVTLGQFKLTSLRKLLTFRGTTSSFPAKWLLRNKPGEIPYWWCVTTQIWPVFSIGSAAREISFNQSKALPRSGQCSLLAVPREKFASTNQKHYPDLGSQTSSVWNFCARSSDVVSRGNQWWHRESRLLFDATKNGSWSSLTVLQWTWGFHRQANQK